MIEATLPRPVLVPPAPPRKYRKSAIPAASLGLYRQRLDAHMRARQPHLDGELTLHELARQLELSAHHLSQVLNISAGVGFYDYLGALRVREARRLLADPACTGRSILDIALAAGFNAKASFNAAFKRHTGMTPTQFRRATPA